MRLPGIGGPHDAFLCGAADREPFRAVRRLEGRDDALRVRLEAPRLFRRASIRSITLGGSRSFSSSIFSPFCFFFNRSFKILGTELAPLRVHDMGGKLQHVLLSLLVLYFI